MRKTLFMLATGLAVLLAVPSSAAELSGGMRVAPSRLAAGPHCREVRVCGQFGCEYRRKCWTGCQGGREARYTCGALYGAYGPWGGTGYWDAYTMAY
jgi:hypothetical protein